ncbi:MAG: beta-propeller fold lactonase family protein [Bacteroidota bacterium]
MRTATTRKNSLSTLRLVFVCLAVLTVNHFVTGQVLVYTDFLQDGVGGVDGLNEPQGIAVSPDNRHVYIASSTDDAVAAFSRSTATGELTFLQVLKDNTQTGGTIARLGGAKRLAISPDGNHVYVACEFDDAVVVFSRDVVTGELTFVESQVDGLGGVDGLNNAYSVAVSPDNEHVYVAGVSDDMIAVFERNLMTGALTFIEVVEDDVSGVNGLNGVRDVALSSDGSFLYTVGSIDDAVSAFSRNSSTGALTFLQTILDTDMGIDGLNNAYGLYISPDDENVYVASATDDAIAVFDRNTGTGLLTFVEVHKDDSQLGGTISNLNAARNASGDAGGEFIFVVSSSDNALVVFSRDPSNGSLTLVEDFIDGMDGVDGLGGARNLAVGPDGREVYALGGVDNSVAIFRFASILPVQLLYFESSLVDEEKGLVKLSWATASEVNNDFFSIEGSMNGEDWQVLKSVPGAGTAHQTSAYSVLLEQSLGLFYYRLKQTDFDGSFSYSPVQWVSRVDLNTALKVYPNPVMETLTLSGENAAHQLTLLNVMGQDVTNLVSIYHTSPTQSKINVGDLPPGLYFLKTTEGTYSVWKK